MKRFTLLSSLYFSLALLSAPVEAAETQYCVAQPSTTESNTYLYQVVASTYEAVHHAPFTPESVWDQTTLTDNKELATALQEYEAGKRGVKAKTLQVKGLTAQEIQALAEKHNFYHIRKPLNAPGKEQYWLKNGQKTTDANHPDNVPIDFYIHQDGSIIRVKPYGVPEKSKDALRRMAHVSKAVLMNLSADNCTPKECHHDNSYPNEAFKVSEEGIALPKAPNKEAGLKLPYDEASLLGKKANRIVKDVVMDQVHINLPTTCAPLLVKVSQ